MDVGIRTKRLPQAEFRRKGSAVAYRENQPEGNSGRMRGNSSRKRTPVVKRLPHPDHAGREQRSPATRPGSAKFPFRSGRAFPSPSFYGLQNAVIAENLLDARAFAQQIAHDIFG